MIALLIALSVSFAGPLGPAAEPATATVDLAVEAAANAGIYGVGPHLGVQATWAPSARGAVGARAIWVGPTGTLAVAGVRWLAVERRWNGGALRLAAVARGATSTRFTGALDVAVAGAGPAIDVEWRRLGLRGAVPIGVSWSSGLETGWGLHLWEAGVSMTTGRHRRGRIELGLATPLTILTVGFVRHTDWGRWRVGLVGAGAAYALPLEVGHGWGPAHHAAELR